MSFSCLYEPLVLMVRKKKREEMSLQSYETPESIFLSDFKKNNNNWVFKLENFIVKLLKDVELCSIFSIYFFQNIIVFFKQMCVFLSRQMQFRRGYLSIVTPNFLFSVDRKQQE